MSITEYQRHQLFTWFEEHMGKDRATTMMNLVPPVGWGDVATGRDLVDLRTATEQSIDSLRHDMDAQFGSMRQEIAEFEARITRTFAGWLFASQAAVIGAVAVLLSIN